jgi:hypothetical protein
LGDLVIWYVNFETWQKKNNINNINKQINKHKQPNTHTYRILISFGIMGSVNPVFLALLLPIGFFYISIREKFVVSSRELER